MLKKNYTKEDVQKAIEILGAECFGALSMANAIGGRQSPEWEILRNNTFSEIVAEGKEKGLNFEEMKCAVTGTPLMRSGYIQFAMGLINESEKKMMFYRHVKNGDGVWPEVWEKAGI